MNNAILVDGCPLCRLFTKKDYKSHVYYIDKNNEYIIVECLTCKTPMIVLGEHLTSTSKELWGRILYTCRKLFGNSVRIRLKQRTIKDHWHGHIENTNRKEKKLRDLRYE